MKKTMLILAALMMSLTTITACNSDSSDNEGSSDVTSNYFGGKKVLVAYFSWGGTTRRMAQEIQRITGGDIFEIEPSTPYPTNYTECTEVALRERDNNERPAIKTVIPNFDDYDVVFVGCPVWWHTAPMIISTFAESYDFSGKTVVPFCTYASTYRDETLQKIVDLTPKADHMQGLGSTGSMSGVQSWLDLLNEQCNNTTGVNATQAATKVTPQAIYTLGGVKVAPSDSLKGVYIVRSATGTQKVVL